MPNDLDPLVDQWYSHQDKGQRFCVTAVDPDAAAVEIQHFDGAIEELSLEEWTELDIELSDEPENWGGALDIGEPDDYGTEVTDTSTEDWTEPGEDFRPKEPERDSGEQQERHGDGYIDADPLE